MKFLVRDPSPCVLQRLPESIFENKPKLILRRPCDGVRVLLPCLDLSGIFCAFYGRTESCTTPTHAGIQRTRRGACKK